MRPPATPRTEGVLRGLVHRGGLRADVIASGTIRVGDILVPGLPPGESSG